MVGRGRRCGDPDALKPGEAPPMSPDRIRPEASWPPVVLFLVQLGFRRLDGLDNRRGIRDAGDQPNAPKASIVSRTRAAD